MEYYPRKIEKKLRNGWEEKVGKTRIAYLPHFFI